MKYFKFFIFLYLLIVNQAFAQDIDVVITPIDGGKYINFGTLNSLTPEGEAISSTSAKEVEITINNNTKKRYQVFHHLTDTIRNDIGTSLPSGNVLFRTEGGKTNGIFAADSETRLEYAETLIFTSNAQGDDETFRIFYTINIPPKQAAGNYNTSIAFSAYTIE